MCQDAKGSWTRDMYLFTIYNSRPLKEAQYVRSGLALLQADAHQAGKWFNYDLLAALTHFLRLFFILVLKNRPFLTQRKPSNIGARWWNDDSAKKAVEYHFAVVPNPIIKML